MLPRALLALLVAITLAGCARHASNFGFGPPPTVPEVRAAVNAYLISDLYRPNSVRNLIIGQPRAACMYRGPGRKNICGYKICLHYNAQNQQGNYTGNKRYDFWITNGWGSQEGPATEECTMGFLDWTGDPPVVERRFCDVEPDHPDCAYGKTEQYAKPPAPPAANTPAQLASGSPSEQSSGVKVSAPSSQIEFAQTQAARWTPATEPELAELADGADRFLKDGASARYRDVVVTPERVPGAKKYCGRINAKNSWGAYNGYTRFVFVSPVFFAMEDQYNGRFISDSCK